MNGTAQGILTARLDEVTGAIGAVSTADPGAGGLTLLNEVPALGPVPCFVSPDRTGRFVLVVIYGTAAGSDTVDQTGPHAHMAVPAWSRGTSPRC